MTILRMTELDLRGKRVFIRADLNVPQDDSGAITDDTRIRASVAGMRHAIDAGAAIRVADAGAAIAAARRLLQDPVRALQMGEAGLAFTRDHRGATARVIEMIEFGDEE